MGSGQRQPALRSALSRQAVLLAVAVVVGSLAALVGWRLSQQPGAWAAVAAAAACWLGAAGGMAVGDALARAPAAGWLVGIIPRMGFPLGLAVVVKVVGGPLFDSGVLYYLLVVYPVVLATEAVLSLPRRSGFPA